MCDMSDAPDTFDERIEEYRGLFARALIERERTPDGGVRFLLRDEPGVEAQVRDLIAREQRCCGFFAFVVDVRDGCIRWDTTVGDSDAEHVMLDGWYRLAATAGDDPQD